MQRQDSWDADDDRILATRVLEAVRTGGSQTDGFENASRELTRTNAACAFRWNSVVRKDYENDLQEAKEERKKLDKRERVRVSNDIVVDATEDPFAPVFDALKTAVIGMKRILKDNENLRREVIRLERELESKPKAEDLDNLLKLIATAKKNGLLNKESPAS